MNKVIVIGGGASGIVAAIFAARGGAKVTLIEQKNRIGKKILATGNGRCNVTNIKLDASRYFSDGPILFNDIFSQFNLSDTMNFFESLGLPLVEKEDGKLYPRSLQATSVVSVLLNELERLKVTIVYEECLKEIQKTDKFKVLTDKSSYYASHVVLATGGLSNVELGSTGLGIQIAEKMGHTTTPCVPSIVQVKTDFQFSKHLKGTKEDCWIQIVDEHGVVLRREFGEVLFTDYGVSGPPVLQLSRIASKRFSTQQKSSIQIDLMPDYDEQSLNKTLSDRFGMLGYKTTHDSLIGLINSKFIVPLLRLSDIPLEEKACNISKSQRLKLVGLLKCLPMTVTGTQDFGQSQVTAGGISTKDVNPTTLESNRISHLYLCGEILDIDGDCGGFNLQWAWSSGAVVGKQCAQ